MYISSIKSTDRVNTNYLKSQEQPKENSSVAFLSRKAFMKLIPSSSPGSLESNILKRLGINPTAVNVKKFANGETYVNIRENLRNCDVFIMHTSGPSVNDNIMETFLKADASRRNGANKIVAIMPNFPYARQERQVEPGEPISASLMANLLENAGVNEVITVDLHAPAIQGFARGMKMTELSSLKTMADYLKSKSLDMAQTVVVSPDFGGAKRADKLAKALGCEKAIINKHRAAHNQAVAETLIGDVKGKNCIIYDDMIDTAGTITQAADMLIRNGANNVYICATHGLFNGPAIERLKNAPVEEVVVTNSERMPITNGYSKIRQVDISEDVVGAMLNVVS